MNLSQQLAKHFRDVHFGGNWTCVNLKDNLTNVTWQQATDKVESFNTILALTYHIHYYVSVVLKVLQGEMLNASDKLSFDHPVIENEAQWQAFLEGCWAEAEQFATLVAALPETKLWETFTDDKYGTYYRNIQGIIEHTHYHLGQIVIIKRLVLQKMNPGKN